MEQLVRFPAITTIFLVLFVLVNSAEHLFLLHKYPGLKFFLDWNPKKIVRNDNNKNRLFILINVGTIIISFLAIFLSIESDALPLFILIIISIHFAFSEFMIASSLDASKHLFLLFLGIVIIGELIELAINQIEFLVKLQLVLVYFIAGIAKLFSQEWKNGEALQKILRSDIFYSERWSSIFSNHIFSKLMCWLTIIWELSSLLLLVNNEMIITSWLVIGFLFHLSLFYILKLNLFFFVFMAVYSFIIL